MTYGFGSWRGDSNPDLLFTRQLPTVHGVLGCAVLAAHVGWVVQPLRSRATTPRSGAEAEPDAVLDSIAELPGLL